MKKDLYLITLICTIGVLMLSICMDYYNVPSLLGLHINTVKYELLGAVLNAVVVIGLYVVTYVIIDKRQIQKEQNAKMVSYVLMNSTYKKCVDYLDMLDDQQVLAKYIVPKIDFNKSAKDDPITINLQSAPFSEYISILDLSKSGFVTHKDLTTYLTIMERYKSYVSERITFFDVGESDRIEHTSLDQRIKSDKRIVREMCEKERRKLKDILAE